MSPLASLPAALALLTLAHAADPGDGWVPLADGKSLAGWTASEENPGTWHLEDGAFVARGPKSHLYYTGDAQPFRNFELKLEVLTEPAANGGVYFHTHYQAQDWPTGGFEVQVNNTHRDWRRTGSLYGVVNLADAVARDGEWWTLHLTVRGNSVTVRVADRIVVEYVEPPGAQPGPVFARKLGAGTFALQAHDPGSVVRYRNPRVKRLPD